MAPYTPPAYILNGKEFADAVCHYVSRINASWERHHVTDWMKTVLPKFGHPDYGWQHEDALIVAKDFIQEASTW